MIKLIIKYPEKLTVGDTIALVSLSQSANLEKIDKAIENLKKLGFNVIEAKNVRKINIL